MKDTDFFERALELKSPWFVEEVRMDVQAKRVEVIIGCQSRASGDPQSGERLHIHGYEKRRWRHLDTMQFETVLVADVPRVKYPDGHTELVSVPWAQPHGRFTLMFEGWAIAVLRACRTVSDACELLDLSWDTAQTIMEGAVKRGIERREVQNIQRVGIDEKSFGRGQDYISVLTDLDHARVIEVVPGRDKGAACSLFKTLSAQELGKSPSNT